MSDDELPGYIIMGNIIYVNILKKYEISKILIYPGIMFSLVILVIFLKCCVS